MPSEPRNSEAEAVSTTGTGLSAADAPPAMDSIATANLDDCHEPLDLDARILCTDGACVGVIGPQGVCKICGLAIDLAAAAPQPGTESASASANPEDGSGSNAVAEPAGAPSDPDDLVDFNLDSRILCSDGACIGVIGLDNRCKVCGEPPADGVS